MLKQLFPSILASGTGSGTDFVRVDTTSANAWAEIVGVDLAKYAGNDSGLTPNLLELRSASGLLQAWLGAQGTGEALSGTEVLDDPGFDDDTKWSIGAGWTVNAGGNSKAVANGAARYIEQTKAVTLGGVYKNTVTMSDYTSGKVRLETCGIVQPEAAGLSATGSHYATAYYTPAGHGVRMSDAGANLSLSAESLQRVKEPAAAGGFHLFASGARGVKTIGTFDPCSVTSYRILGHRRVAGRGIW